MTEHRRLDLAPEGAPAPGETRGGGVDGWLAFEMDLADEELPAPGAVFYSAAAVRLETGAVADHDAGDTVVPVGARVVCEASPGVPSSIASGVVVVATRRTLATARLPRILRTASEDDRAVEADLRAREQKVYSAARTAVLELGLPAKIVRAEASAGGQAFLVYFASEERVAFRDFLTRVSEATLERVELRQVGLRDATKVVGGVGPCGLQLCCNTFLSEFAPITIKMAKDQGLGVNPQKLSGLCGRLLCCLVYEEAYYRAQRQLVPRVGERVGVDRGEGRVREVDVLQMRVKVALDSGETVTRPIGELTRREKNHG
jgi:cell fate regulator YaaT (PSP1 superfamily)